MLGEIVEFKRSTVEGKQTPEAKVDLGGEDAATAGHFDSPGDDSFPLATDVVCLSRDTGTGNRQIVGYQDPDTAPVATAGEKRIYSRSGPGAVACAVYLKSDGTLLLSNESSSIELTPDGVWKVTNENGSIELTSSGTCKVSNAQGSIELGSGTVVVTTPLGTFGASTHQHTSAMGPTGPPIPGT